jgi:pimeloyl-ACP methyl ester carboxylesterase
VNHSAATFGDKDSIYAGWADVPVWYLHCAEDNTMNIRAQEAMVAGAKQAGASVTIKTLQAGHSPFLSKVDETVEFIREACEALM